MSLSDVDIRNQELADVQAVLRLAEGRRFYKRWVKSTHVLEQTHITDPVLLARHEAVRNIGLALLAETGTEQASLLTEICNELNQKLEANNGRRINNR